MCGKNIKLSEDSNKYLVRCNICNKNFKGLAGHLKCKHGISTYEYMEKYPGSLTMPQSFYDSIVDKKTRNCEGCNKEFITEDIRTRFCSSKCIYTYTSNIRIGKTRSKKIETKSCTFCKKSITRKNYKSDNFFCNKKCYNDYRDINRITKKCLYEQCNNCISVGKKTSETRKYCSRDCYKKDYNEIRETWDVSRKNGYVNHRKGYYYSIKNNIDMWFDSGYELTRMKQLDLDNDVISWSKCRIKIPYLQEDNTEHIYTPDLELVYKDCTVVEEIKGRITKNDLIKIEFGRKFFENSKYTYKIVNYDDIYLDDYLEPIFEKYTNRFGEFQRISMIYTYMNMSRDISHRSTCIRKHVGCIVAPLDLFNIYSIGYNGSKSKSENGCERLESGNCGCIHAEMNALNKIKEFNIQIEDSILFCTLTPCYKCSLEILKYPIKKVVYLEKYRSKEGLTLLVEHGVDVVYYPDLVKSENDKLLIYKR